MEGEDNFEGLKIDEALTDEQVSHLKNFTILHTILFLID
jgi:hypothetical protein